MNAYIKLCYVLSLHGKVRLVRAMWWKCFLVISVQAEVGMAIIRILWIKEISKLSGNYMSSTNPEAPRKCKLLGLYDNYLTHRNVTFV